jgi:hypothetical protein
VDTGPLKRFAALLPLPGLIVVACGMLGSAAEGCAAAARGYSGTVVGAFDTSVGAIRGLAPRAGEPSRWPRLADDHPAVLCYIDAVIAKAPPPPPDGPPPEPYDRVVVGIVDGNGEMIIAGYREQLPVRAP